jgi:tyrosyl-tRNA synthetase
MPPTSWSLDDDIAALTKGCSHVIEEADLRRKLERARAGGKELVIKVGFDPSAPDIHLGHTVLLHKMRHFQNRGHKVIFLVGDFTGMIGDPSGKKATRPQLSREEIEENARTYAEQCFKVLIKNKTEIRYNSEWFLGGGKEKRPPLGADGFVRLASKITLARILERDDFQKRWNAHHPIALHELMYPLSQAYDSVALRADVELGGTDQLFNLLLGRDLMREEGMEPQVVMTVPLLVGTDGIEKMSKSLGNAIGIDDPPEEMYGKLMSISDDTMWSYLLLLTDDTEAEIEARKAEVASGALHPMEVKKALARRLVERYHPGQGERAEAEFVRVFSRRQDPERVEEIRLPASEADEPLSKVLAEAGLAASNAEARRLIASGAVDLDEERCTDVKARISRRRGQARRVRVGKRRFAKIQFE